MTRSLSTCVSLILTLLVFILRDSGAQKETDLSFMSSCIGQNEEWRVYEKDFVHSWIHSITPQMRNSSSRITVRLIPNDVIVTSIRNPNEIMWRKNNVYLHNGWFYGKRDEETKDFYNDEAVFIYPDFETVLMGEFDYDLKMEKAHEGLITHYRCIDGMVELSFSPKVGKIPSYSHEKISEDFISSTPLVEDPLESKQVFVNVSTLPNAGEGLFTKKRMASHSLLAYYGGIKEKKSKNSTDDDYRVSLGNTYTLNIPLEYRSTRNYKASLGHKVNHSFENTNSYYCAVHHPRFGYILGICSSRLLEENEEILIDYKYGEPDEETPEWYNSLYKSHFSKQGKDEL